MSAAKKRTEKRARPARAGSRKGAKKRQGSKPGSPGRRAASKAAEAGSKESEPQFTIRAFSEAGDGVGSVDLSVTEDTIATAQLAQMAMEWTGILRDRKRWRGSQKTYRQAQASLNKRILERFSLFTLGDIDSLGSHIQVLARASLIEVRIPFAPEDLDYRWPSRVMPWEFLISAATKKARGERALTVVRHLDTPREPSANTSAPVLLSGLARPSAGRDHFEDVRAYFKTVLGELEALDRPTLAEASARLQQARPRLVHFRGLDVHEAREALKSRLASLESVDGEALAGEPEGWDGLCFRDANHRPGWTNAVEVGKAFGAASPDVVTLAAHNTAARVAPMIVGHGARHAIGIQDDLDPVLCDLFFEVFFQAWRHSCGDVLAAFELAWGEVLRQGQSLKGSGVVLWSARSLLDERQRDLVASLERRSESGKKLGKERAVVVGHDSPALSWTIVPHEVLNYSLLHNGRGLFKTFTVTRPLGRLRGLGVEVALQVGRDHFPCRFLCDLTLPLTDLNAEVRVPLTWQFIRDLPESVRTTIHVRLVHDGAVLHDKTYPVMLQPANEWQDNETDGKWLPSFVLPRDPAVARIIQRAHRNLKVLCDNAEAAFDGYQSAGRSGESVDLQVRAIWSAIANDFAPEYCNPPPSYTPFSQRLRTPSTILNNDVGTCIDLSLLFLACLEAIDIYPVMFLLTGHAFPGYWRTEACYQSFIASLENRSLDSDPASWEELDKAHQTSFEAWELPSYRSVAYFVSNGLLVPFESVSLTTHKSFALALAEGQENLGLAREDEFDRMIDVVRARLEGVTPLPFGGPAQ